MSCQSYAKVNLNYLVNGSKKKTAKKLHVSLELLPLSPCPLALKSLKCLMTKTFKLAPFNSVSPGNRRKYFSFVAVK